MIKNIIKMAYPNENMKSFNPCVKTKSKTPVLPDNKWTIAMKRAAHVN